VALIITPIVTEGNSPGKKSGQELFRRIAGPATGAQRRLQVQTLGRARRPALRAERPSAQHGQTQGLSLGLTLREVDESHSSIRRPAPRT